MEETKQHKGISVKVLRSVAVFGGYFCLYALLLYATVFICQKGYQFCYEIFGSVVAAEAPGEEIAFQVEATDTMKSVSKRLEKKGLVVNQYSFFMRTKLMDSKKVTLRPGIYLLNTHMDYEDIINQLTVKV